MKNINKKLTLIIIFLIFSGESSASSEKNLYRSITSRLSRNRQDYLYLTDIEFANFREVKTTGIGKNKLDRKSTRLNSSH